MNHKKIPSHYTTNIYSQQVSRHNQGLHPPSSAGGQSMQGSGYQAIPPGSRHMQRMTFIEEKFPLNMNHL